MIGLKYLRSCLGISAEAFGKQVGVSRTLISRWENGLQKISRTSLENISNAFCCDKKDLQDEVTDESMIRLSKAAADYAQAYLGSNLNDDLVNEINNLEYQEKIRKITNRLYDDPEFMELVYKMMNMLEKAGIGDLRLLIALGELIAEGKDYNVAVGSSNYRRGLIAKNDPDAAMAMFALKHILKDKECD